MILTATAAATIWIMTSLGVAVLAALFVRDAS